MKWCLEAPHTFCAGAVLDRPFSDPLTLFIPGGGGGGWISPPPPLIFFSITFEAFIVTPSNFVTLPNFYLSLLWEKKCCLGMILYGEFYFSCIVKKNVFEEKSGKNIGENSRHRKSADVIIFFCTNVFTKRRCTPVTSFKAKA